MSFTTPPLPDLGPYPSIDEAAREPHSFLGGVFDFLSRGQYASAKFFDTLATDANATFVSALGAAASELINPRQRLSFDDVIQHVNPVFAAEHPTAKKVLGFIGNVALDPTSWLNWSKPVLNAVGKLRYFDEVAKVGRVITGELPTGIAEKVVKGVPDEALKLMKPEDFARPIQNELKSIPGLWDRGGLKLGPVKILPREVMDGISKTFGLDRLLKGIKETETFLKLKQDFIDPAVGLVSRYHAFAPAIARTSKETQVALHGMYGEAKEAGEELFRMADKLKLDFTKEGRSRIGQIMTEMDDAGYYEYDNLLKSGLDEETAFKTLEDKAPDLRKQVMDRVNATPQERAMIGEMYHRYNDLWNLQHRHELIKHRVVNYNPRILEKVENPGQFIEELAEVRNPALPAAKARKLSPEEILESGRNPVTDALELYTTRYLQAKKAVAMKNYSDIIKKMYPGEIPDKYIKDFRFIGEGDYGKGLTDGMRKGLEMYDRGLNIFRRFATSIRLSFAPKQAFSNTLQEVAVLGKDAAGAFNPEVFQDAVTLLSMDSRIIPRRELIDMPDGTLAWKESDAFSKLARVKVRNDFGDAPTTYGEFLDEVRQYGLTEGRNATGIETLKNNVMETLEKERQAFGRGTEWEGLARAFKGVANYMSWPGLIENFSKVSFYLNARRLGYTAKEASDLTYNALFDYAHGLSQFERRFARRIIPFYSFQRFAYPLVVKTLFTHPGRITVPVKGVEALFSAFAKIDKGEDLTTNDRYALPPYLLEQNYMGRDNDMKAIFRYLPNLTPIDVFDTVETDDNGNFDFARTLQRAVFSQIAPFIKLPIEIVAGKNLFTDRMISPAKNARSGIIGKVDPDQFLQNMFSMFSAKWGGLVGLAGGQVAASAVPAKGRDILLKLLGWEQGIDPRSQQPTVYVNPWTMLAIGDIMPSFNQAIRFAKDRPRIDNWLDLMTGTLSQRVETDKYLTYKFKANKNKISDLRSQYKLALEQQRYDEADKRRQELEDFIAAMQREYSQLETQPYKLF